MLDIILIFFFVLMIFLGWKHGFVKAFLRFFGFFISAAIAYLSYKPVSNWLMTTPLADNIQSFIKNDAVKGEQPSIILNLPLLGDLGSSLQEAIDSGVESAVNGIAASITALFISLISMVLVFVLAFVAMKVLELLLQSIVKLPVLSFFNKVCGLVVGVINGSICVYLLAFLAVALIPFTPWLADWSEQSVITKLIGIYPK